MNKQKTKKRNILIGSFLVILLTSCNLITNTTSISENIDKNLKIKSVNEKKIQPKDLEQEYPSPSFDEVPSYSKDNIVPGYVNVIYRNNRKIRINKLDKGIKSHDNETSNSINKILKKYGVQEILDGGGDDDERILDEKEKFLSEKSKTEIPHLKSVHVYKFPDDADTIKISEELRNLPFVRTAYPDIKASTTAFQELFEQTKYTVRYSGSIPNDPSFSSTEEGEWTLFNKHKIFHAWDSYISMVGGTDINNAPKPTIAVIDSGFDTGFIGNDRPNYLSGFSIDNNNNKDDSLGATDCLKSDPIYDSTSKSTEDVDTICHGARMSSLIGSPSNNNYGISGVLPNVPIIPIKVKTVTGSAIGFAIKRAADSSAKIINVSLALKNSNDKEIPISFSPTIATQIYYATYSSNKPVVISAGNENVNLDNSSGIILTGTTPCSPQPSCQDKGQVIVGGSSSNGLMWSSTKGTSYGKPITLTAHAGFPNTNRASSYDVTSSNPSSSYSPVGRAGTSDSTAIVTGAIAMMIQIGNTLSYNYTAAQLRDIVAYTGTPLRSSTVSDSTETKFLGKDLYIPVSQTDVDQPTKMTSNRTENVLNIAGMRDLNTYNAISFVYYAAMFNNITRIFNIDSNSSATTYSADWNNKYTSEVTGNDSFWGSNDYPNPTSLSQLWFRTISSGSKSSFGYQVYRNGLLSKERILGVSKVYKTWIDDYLTNTSGTLYQTQGVNSGTYPTTGSYFYYTIPQ